MEHHDETQIPQEDSPQFPQVPLPLIASSAKEPCRQVRCSYWRCWPQQHVFGLATLQDIPMAASLDQTHNSFISPQANGCVVHVSDATCGTCEAERKA